jgi:hypothetical protein
VTLKRGGERIIAWPRGSAKTGGTRGYIGSTGRYGRIVQFPASSIIANETVRAATFYTKEDDGLTQRWGGRVWMNPPYGQPLIAQFSEAFAARYEAGEFEQGVVLVNNATETAWFQRLVRIASAVCFPAGRVRFIDADGQANGAPLQGQSVLYCGREVGAFEDQFRQFGHVLRATSPRVAAGWRAAS